MNNLEIKLRKTLQSYIKEAEQKKDTVTQEDVDMLVNSAVFHHVEQEIIDYAVEHPEAPFWDFLGFLRPGIFGLDEEDEDDECSMGEYMKEFISLYPKGNIREYLEFLKQKDE